MVFDRHNVGKADADTHEQAMKRRGFELVDRNELDPETWVYQWSPAVPKKASAPAAKRRSAPAAKKPSAPIAKKPSVPVAKKSTGQPGGRTAAMPAKGTVRRPTRPSPRSPGVSRAPDAEALTDELIAAYQLTLREARASVPPDQLPLVVNAVGQSARQAARDMKQRLSVPASERLDHFREDLPDYLGKVLGWLGDQATDIGKKQAAGIVTGTTTLAMIQAKIAFAGTVAAAVAASIATALWNVGAAASASTGFMVHVLPGFLASGAATKWANNRKDDIKKAWEGPKDAIRYLDQVLTPVEVKAFAQLGSSPPRRVVLKTSGAIEAAIIGIVSVVIAVACVIFFLGAVVTWVKLIGKAGNAGG